MALEQREAETFLQQPHLLAHGRLGNVQLLCGESEAAKACGCLECSEPVQECRALGHFKYPNFFWAIALDQIAGPANRFAEKYVQQAMLVAGVSVGDACAKSWRDSLSNARS